MTEVINKKQSRKIKVNWNLLTVVETKSRQDPYGEDRELISYNEVALIDLRKAYAITADERELTICYPKKNIVLSYPNEDEIAAITQIFATINLDLEKINDGYYDEQ